MTDWSAVARRARQRDRIAWLRWDWWLVADRPPAPESARGLDSRLESHN